MGLTFAYLCYLLSPFLGLLEGYRRGGLEVDLFPQLPKISICSLKLS